MRSDSLYNESNKSSGKRSKINVSRREINQQQQQPIRSIPTIQPKITKIENSSSQIGEIAEKNAAGSKYDTVASINTESNNPISASNRFKQPEQISNIAINVTNYENEKRANVENMNEFQSLLIELQTEYNQTSNESTNINENNINNNSSINLLDGIKNKTEDFNNLNAILNELCDLTKEISSDQELSSLSTLSQNPSENDFNREQSQINWFLNQNDQAQVFENFDIDLFDNVLIYNNDPMIGEIKL